MALDILLDPDGDLLIQNGDFVVGDGDEQNLQDLLEINPGELKTRPLVGIGVVRMAKKRQGPELILGDVRSQLKADGWINPDVRYTETALSVKAERPE